MAREPHDRKVGDPAADEPRVADTRGRFWALRPTPRGRYDYLGIGVLWWTAFWVVLAAFLVWLIWAA